MERQLRASVFRSLPSQKCMLSVPQPLPSAQSQLSLFSQLTLQRIAWVHSSSSLPSQQPSIIVIRLPPLRPPLTLLLPKSSMTFLLLNSTDSSIFLEICTIIDTVIHSLPFPMLTFHFLDPAWLGFPSSSEIRLQLELSCSSVFTLQIPLGQFNDPYNFNYHLILMDSTYMCHSHFTCPKLNFSFFCPKNLLLPLLSSLFQ